MPRLPHAAAVLAADLISKKGNESVNNLVDELDEYNGLLLNRMCAIMLPLTWRADTSQQRRTR